MKTQFKALALFVLLGTLILSACGGAAAPAATEAAARDLPTQLVIGAAAQRKLIKHKTTSLGRITLRGTETTIEVFTIGLD